MNEIIVKEQILNAEQQLISAMKAADIEMLNKLLHDDLLFVLPNGETITKSKDIETYKSGNLIIEELQSDLNEIRILEGLAVVTITNQLSARYLGNSFDGKFKYIRVWKLFNDQWQVIAGSGIKL